jgi:hypothetical protein
MGVNGYRSSSHGSSYCTTCAANPNPNYYKVVKVEERHGFLIVKIKYDNCTNYEGNKIMVYRGVKVIDLINHPPLDPHFAKSGMAPIARFEPTDAGWMMATMFVDAYWGVETSR